MLEKEITMQPDAVEQFFCVPFDKLKRFPMTEENTKYLMKLLFADRQVNIPEKEKPFLMKVIEKRVKYCFGYTMDDTRLHLFLAIIAQSPGTAVMYLTYLQYWCKKHNCQAVDLNKFCEIFPIGFPCENDLQKVWDGQKVKSESTQSDNLLDYQSAMVSIQFN